MSKDDVAIDNEELMDSLNLIDDGNIKRAGILLFHHNPEKWVPGSFIKIAYFKTESDIVYQDEVRGALLSQADKTVITSPSYTNAGVYHIRNRYLVDHCSLIVCYFNGTPGGTQKTLEFAQRSGKQIITLNP